MCDERALVARFESADAEELMALLNRPTRDVETALRMHLGVPLYQRMHGLALKCRRPGDLDGTRGNVVIIPGFLGSELSLVGLDGRNEERLWLNVPRIMQGALERLQLADDGLRAFHANDMIRASGLIKRQYGELMLALARRWNVRAFYYDWRKDLEQTAGELLGRIDDWFGVDAPVHLVAHGMGGLVARTFIRNQPARWRAMRGGDPRRASGGRLIMLGTPNHGSFLALQALCGVGDFVKGITAIDQHHERHDLLKILRSFVSVYQMLPSPLVNPVLESLYEVATYGELSLSNRHLRKARQDHDKLTSEVDHPWMIEVLGTGFRTTSRIEDTRKVTSEDKYRDSWRGDGMVEVDFGRLRDKKGKPALDAYFLHEHHAGLASSPALLASIDELLETGKTSRLGREVPESPDMAPATANGAPKPDRAPTPGHDPLGQAVRGLSVRDPTDGHRLRPEEGLLSQHLLRGLSTPVESTGRRALVASPIPPPRIELGLERSRLAKFSYDKVNSKRGNHPVDVIALGLYYGGRPEGQERKLDEDITRAHLKKLGIEKPRLEDSDLLLTSYAERGIIRGELGQPFFLDDPRCKQPGGRMIAVAGMGLPGRFGVPELTVLVRELIWSVGRLGRRHLCVASIGTRNANLSVEEAISGWVRGVKAALTGVDESELQHLVRITFLVANPRKVARFQKAIQTEQRKYEGRMEIEFTPFTPEQLADFNRQDAERDGKDAGGDATDTDAPRTPTRVTWGLDRTGYHVGAITEDASIPERTLTLDPALVGQANRELAAETDPDQQLERGRFLERLIVPNDLRQLMTSDAPLVMMLDATTARICWEMVATTDPVSGNEQPTAPQDATEDRLGSFEFQDYFLGTSRGFTRQLRTAFAPPPEPPPPPRRLLRVLVVADPDEDAPLPGAEAEGIEVADLFEAFNAAYEATSQNRVEVVRLIGPRDATRTNVLREVMLRTYDVLHYAGHCVYDEADPRASGWIFGKDQRITTAELTRIDRVPKFIFSNACESGVMPDRSEDVKPGLAPSFAEAFFERGVSNFVCTAWPVDDAPARLFALILYRNLLGLRPVGDRSDRHETVDALTMVNAMREARLAVAPSEGGIRTWGAYQHYGNPNFRFFAARRAGADVDASRTEQTAARAEAAPNGGSKRRSRRRT